MISTINGTVVKTLNSLQPNRDVVVARIAFSGRDELRLVSIDIQEDYRHLGIIEELLSHVEGIYGRDLLASDSECNGISCSGDLEL